MKDNHPYRKHVYWLTREEEGRLRRSLAGRGINLKSARGIVCAPLDKINRITSVAPEVWNETCSRQGSWYRVSVKNGLYLIVSSFELDGWADKKASTITESDFIPPHMASPKEKNALFKEVLLKNQLPGEWRQVGDREKRTYLGWAQKLGSDVLDYDFLYVSHTANHANFINPRLFVRDNDGIIPYSIDQSAHLCSCCLELFHVLGGQHNRILVAPCPGAVIFSRLRQDRYLLVERHQKGPGPGGAGD